MKHGRGDAEGEVLEEALKKWSEDNLALIEERGYANKPESSELDEGGYLDNASLTLRIPDIEVARSEFLRLNEGAARELGLMICPIKEYRRLEKRNESLEAENESLRKENTHLRERIKWLEEQVRGLPTRRYRVLKPYGILQAGQVIETFNIPWAEGLAEQGFLEPVADGGNSDCLEGGYISVEQYCPSVKRIVMLKVEGEVRGSIVSGVVKSCSDGKCGETGFCWLNKNILTAAR